MSEELKKEIGIIINDSENQVFSIVDDEIVININGVAYEDFKDIFGDQTLDITEPFTNITLWYVVPINDFKVMVLNDIPIYVQDFIMTITCVALCGVLIAVFVVYYLISVISMVFDVRKTIKIIYTDMVTGGDNWSDDYVLIDSGIFGLSIG